MVHPVSSYCAKTLVDLRTGNSVTLFIKLGIKPRAAKKNRFLQTQISVQFTQSNINKMETEILYLSFRAS